MGRDEGRKIKGQRARRLSSYYGEGLSREQGAVIKDWGGRLPVALIYPNSYYVGMSNLGIHAIYNLLNSYSNVVCERVFKESNGRLLSLESGRPLSDFSVLAFSISYELDYLNIARILRDGGIPPYAAERDQRYPLVIAGGACVTANSMPIAPFFDCLCIGEAESILPAVISALAEGVSGKRDVLLKALAGLPGIYVPLLSEGISVVRQWARDLDNFPVGSVVLTPATELSDLYLIEVGRGCNWGCRFCLVSSAFCPVRYRSINKLIEQAKLGLKYRRRLGLVGSVVTGHPQIEELLFRLRQMGAGLAISSLRVSPLSGAVLRELALGGARTIALAPEAGSQRLRQLIKKGISENDILEAVAKVAQAGIKKLKLYFMIGLPSETDEDIEEIITLAIKCKDILGSGLTGCRLSLNVAPFVPKAGTPFQWLPMASLAILNRRLSLLKKRLPSKGIKLKCESPAWSQVQGVLARGDMKLAAVLAGIEETSLSGWRKAVEKAQLDIDFYAHKRWDVGQELPWAVLDLGIKPGQLKRELNRALESKLGLKP